MLIACTSILSLFSSHLCFDQFIFTLCSLPYVHFHNSIYSSFSISLWLPDDFGLFYAFPVFYVHSHRLCSVFPSGSRMILDFFTAFLGFMSIFLVAFTPVSVFLSGFRRILDFFTAFSVLYVHFLLPGSVFPSSFRMILDFFPIFLSFMSIWKNTEDSGPRKAALRRIKRSAITTFLFQKLLSRLP